MRAMCHNIAESIIHLAAYFSHMKAIYALIMGLHGLIHLMGFVKGFGIKDIKNLKLSISKPMAVFWLCVGLVIIAYVILWLLSIPYAWILGIAGAILSQVLLIMYWQDAKFGTIANVVILVVCVFHIGQFRFDRMVRSEVLEQMDTLPTDQGRAITEQDIDALPFSVQKWLTHSGVVGKSTIRYAKLRQQAIMKMRPGQKDWMHATATQYTDLKEPAFHWTVAAQMCPLIYFSGRDRFIDGQGEMLIKLNGLIPIVNESGPKLTEGSAQRFLGELVWFPTFALSRYVSWTSINDTSAAAIINYKGATVSGTFRFNTSGDFVQFSTMRFKENTPNAERYEWVLDALDHQEFEGVRIPSYMTATWKLPEGDWTWLELQLLDVHYNEHHNGK